MNNNYTYDEVLSSSLEYFNGDDLAATTWINKYSLRDKDGNIKEKNPDDMHRRMAKEFGRMENILSKDLSNIESVSKYGREREKLTEEKVYNYFKNFKYLIPQGSIMAGLGNTHQLVSLSNCIVIKSPFDSYAGIAYADQQLAQLMKRRCGVGLDISTLRPEGLIVNNAAKTATGAVSFMERFSSTTREVAQGGRRGALMITIDIRHPDVEKFINIKKDLSKVTGANISVKLNDEFMNAVDKDLDFNLRFPVNSDNVVKTVKAKDLWNSIITAAHTSAEPGIIFWDNQHWYSTSSVYPNFENESTNPCLTKDTLVAVADGRNAVSFETLVNERKDVKVWCTDNQGFPHIRTMRAPRKTGIDQDIIRVIFTNGNYIRCTKNHKFILTNGELKEAFNLEAGDSVMSRVITKLPIKFENLEYTKSELTDAIVHEVVIDGKEDVYCGTVDDYHNFGVYFEKDSSMVFVKNCSEIAMQGGDSCRLMVINLFEFINNPFTENASFDYNKFYEVTYEAQRLMDDVVELEIECVDKIINKIMQDPEPEHIKSVELDTWKLLREQGKLGRRTGLGFTALADTLAALNIKFDSDLALETTDKIMMTKCAGEWDSSIDMAIERGKFECFDANIEETSLFIQMLKNKLPEVYERNKKYGRRNISISTVAPTGTVSMMSQSSSGIEPVYMLSYMRRRKVNPNDPNSKVDYVDALGDSWMHFEVNHPKYGMWKQITGKSNVEESPYYKCTAPEINWEKRVQLQNTIQQYTSHSISSTINLPNTATVEEVSDIYMKSWKNKLKGITVYRDGSRSGVLVSKESASKKNNKENNEATKRPITLECDIHYSNIKGETWAFFVGKLPSGEPYEIFGGKKGLIHIPHKYKSGWIKKNGKDANGIRTYDLYLESLDDENTQIIVKNLAAVFQLEEGAYTRIISTMIRHNVPMRFICEQLQKTSSQNNMFTFERSISRVLKKYIKNGETSSSSCPQCQQKTLIYEEGCMKCSSCGYSGCH